MPSDQRRPAAKVTVSGSETVLSFAGALDRTTDAELATCLGQALAGRPDRLVYDMSAVSYVDYRAASTLITAGGRFPPGRRPVLRNPSPAVVRILEVTGLGLDCVIEFPGE